MKQEVLQVLCEIAIFSAVEAGKMVEKYIDHDIDVQEKDTGSSRASQVVTQVDFMSQEMILKHIVPTCDKYNLGLLTEESEDDLSRFEKDYFWCIDPLDGTLSFIEKRPGYAISIALVSREGHSYLGVIYDPQSQTLYHAIKGLGAFRNQKAWNWQPQFNDLYEEIDSGGAVMNACWVLEKAPACFVKKPKEENGGGCLWDYAATCCLFEELGAIASDIYGERLDLNSCDSVFMNRKGVLYASHSQLQKLHQFSC